MQNHGNMANGAQSVAVYSINGRQRPLQLIYFHRTLGWQIGDKYSICQSFVSKTINCSKNWLEFALTKVTAE